MYLDCLTVDETTGIYTLRCYLVHTCDDCGDEFQEDTVTVISDVLRDGRPVIPSELSGKDVVHCSDCAAAYEEALS